MFRLLPWGAVTLLPLLLVPALAAWGFGRLLDRRPLATVGATLLFVVNPFVYERMLAGQIYLVVGYSLLPLFLSLVLSRSDGPAAPTAAGLLFALLTALSPHFLFLGGVLIVVAVAASIRMTPRRTLERAGVTLLVAAGASLYWLVPIATHASELERVTGTDLETFRTLPDPAFGLAGNVAGLYGFWREGPPLPKDNLPAWPLLLAAILVVAAIGVRTAAPGPTRTLTRILLVAGAAGFLLALGSYGVTGAGFRWMFDHVPGFRIMREPEKFEALLALVYAGLFGLGVDTLAKSSRTRRVRAIVTIVTLALPCAYTFRMFWGFAGYARPSDYPASWNQAAALMGSGPEKILALPGDQYLSFPWTQDRPVASPLDGFFDRDVLLDGRLGLSGVESQTADAQSRYLRFIADHGASATRFGNLVAPLGVRYVLLVKTGDWARYAWLDDQSDLRLLKAWPDLELFENLELVATAYAPQRSIEVQDWGEVVGLAERTRLGDLAVTVRDAAPGPIRTPSISIPASTGRSLTIVSSSPVGYEVMSSPGGWIALAEPFDPAWRLEGRGPVANLGVTDLFPAPTAAGPAEIRYERWPLVRTSYLLSLTSILAALLFVAVSISGRRSRGRQEPRQDQERRAASHLCSRG